MIQEVSVHYRRFVERHASFDARSPAGHIKLVTDAVQVAKFGEQDASIWFSFTDRKSMLVGSVLETPYHSDAVKKGGWHSVVKQTLEGLHRIHEFSSEDIVAVSLCYDVVNDDLEQFRVVHTWTPETFLSAFCTIGSWTWNWVPNPSSTTAAEIQQLIFGNTTTKEESNGS